MREQRKFNFLMFFSHFSRVFLAFFMREKSIMQERTGKRKNGKNASETMHIIVRGLV